MARCRRNSSCGSLEEDTASAGRPTAQHCHTFKRRSARTAPRNANGSMKEPMTDKAHQKVRKACVRCRMKKTKCDGKIPCRRCKDDQKICTASARRTITFKHAPRGYAEVLEQSQYILIETIFKLYGMVRNSQPWKLAEPQLNEHGKPVAQHIAKLLGCVPPNADIDLPVGSIFPEDVDSLEELYHELEEHERSEAASTPSLAREKELSCDESAISEPQDSDMDPPYYWADCQTQGTVDLLLQTRSHGLDFEGAVAADMYGNALFPDTPPSPLAWNSYIDGRTDSTLCPLQQVGVMQGSGMLQQGLLRPVLEGDEPYSMSVDLGMRHRERE
ncbi:related to zinc cluster transcription factor [Fusarium fujikuroi IMI 58289]|uniref:Related to zinc cluster transcription factor n=1 Tax=Gibberella fujikuroi (strain CBS 195.34 / IMI 58289 / NRRL A-6831) TaxID=1279085 RepID=S0E4C1_GIBF5|nr:related to zinc cluster transcription factor [Fusarium fujikuroi IMI 58289]CCT69515.1 related to zinc cluster transcription factor [Fusarium fujikuroi IMI 58289]